MAAISVSSCVVSCGQSSPHYALLTYLRDSTSWHKWFHLFQELRPAQIYRHSFLDIAMLWFTKEVDVQTPIVAVGNDGLEPNAVVYAFKWGKTLEMVELKVIDNSFCVQATFLNFTGLCVNFGQSHSLDGEWGGIWPRECSIPWDRLPWKQRNAQAAVELIWLSENFQKVEAYHVPKSCKEFVFIHN